MLHFAIAELLRPHPPSVAEVASKIHYQIARNEKARRDRWRAKGFIAPAKRVS
jgi:hypothetical protein